MSNNYTTCRRNISTSNMIDRINRNNNKDTRLLEEY